jgi:acyl carrier protein
LAIFAAIRRAFAPGPFDESAISIDAWARTIGGTMDARAAPQAGFNPNKVRALIAKYLGIDAKQVTDEAHFRNDFDLDSLDRLELLTLIEDEFFGVEISDDAIKETEVVGDLIRHMEIKYLLGQLYVEPFRRSAA